MSTLQKQLKVSTWQVVATDFHLTGDLMFILGGFGEQLTVPVGRSFTHRGMNNYRHDAVAARLMLPVCRRRAASGASQPAEVPEEWQEWDARHGCGFGLQHWNPEDPGDVDPTTVPLPSEESAEVSSKDSVEVTSPWETVPLPWSSSEDTDDGSETSGVSLTEVNEQRERFRKLVEAEDMAKPCVRNQRTGDDSSWSSSEYTDDGSETAGVSRTEVNELRERFRKVVEAEEEAKPCVRNQLGKLLFKKRTSYLGGIKQEYVVSYEDTLHMIQKLLNRRRRFMNAKNLSDGPRGVGGASQPAVNSRGAPRFDDGRYVFSPQDR